MTIFALTIVAAYYDHYKIPASELLLSFSLKRNFKQLVSLERQPNDIATLHGVRAINAGMLLLAHKSMALFFNPYANRTEMSEVWLHYLKNIFYYFNKKVYNTFIFSTLVNHGQS